jgi:hypothetical protein
MKLTQTYPQLVESLNDVRRQWRTSKLLEGALLAAGGTFAVLLLSVAADNLFSLNALGRWLLSLALWGTLIASLIRLVVQRILEDRRDDYFAVLVEQKHPELHNRLINALQLGRGHQNGHSPRLIAAIVQDAASATADMDPAAAVDWRRTGRSAVFSGIVISLLVLYAVFLWPYFAAGMGRVMLPFADIDPYTATRVAVLHEQDRVAEGTPVTINARVSGEIPDRAFLHLRVGDGRWQEPVEMKGGAEQCGNDEERSKLFHHKVPAVTRALTYYVTAGDGRSRAYQVNVVPRPEIKELAITYTRPSYTGTSPYTVNKGDGEISGLAGTLVTLNLTSSKPLQTAQMVVRNGNLRDLTVPAFDKAGDEYHWKSSFVLWSKDASEKEKFAEHPGTTRIEAPGQYYLQLLDTEGFESRDPRVRPITLVTDQPPSVMITAPGRDLQVQPGEAVPLTFEAQDDFGVGSVRILYRINNDKTERELCKFGHVGKPRVQTRDRYRWANFRAAGIKAGDRVEYWAHVTDRNQITGPGEGVSRPFTITFLNPELVAMKLDEQVFDFAEAVELLLKLQRQNLAQTNSGFDFPPLIARQLLIRKETGKLARRMEESALPVASMVKTLDTLHRGLMVEAVTTLERGRDAAQPEAADRQRSASATAQKKIIAELEALLLRLQNNEEAKKALRRIQKKDPLTHKKITEQLSKMIKGLDQLLKDETELLAKFQRMPKKTDDKLKEDKFKLTKEMEEMQKKWEKWAKGTVEELAKLPTGFVDDFNLRKDVNKIYEEIEKAAERSKASKIEVSLEDMGVGLGTKMKEDLETWMPDSPDAVKWVMEEPLNKKTPKVPEMPLPKKLEDLIGDLLQKAEEFDEEADDVTSAWGDNLDQAGWGVSDGPISTFSAKGKTGNDLPNNHEVSGRSGDGRRGKSSGQIVGDTARNLQGRKTPARVGNERYEPGQLKQESNADPQGATGGGKKAGAGRKGLQGGTPPDVVKQIGRLSAKQAGVREKAEQVARKLATAGIQSSRLGKGIELFKQSEKDLRDLRYQDAARKRKLALRALKGAALEIDQNSGLSLSRRRDLPPEMRNELLQGADDGYPPGYEALLKNYYKELSKVEK